jgi:DNA-binding HxlR family transcriptional regulator
VKRKSLATMECPIAQTLERVGDKWSILILRDAMKGKTRFDEFQRSMDIAPNILTGRLSNLVDSGFLARRRYSEHPPRDEYVLTDIGRDFQSVVQAMVGFGNRNFSEASGSVSFVDTQTGREADPITVDRHTGEAIALPRFVLRSEQAQAL